MLEVDALSRNPIVAAIHEGDIDVNIQITLIRDAMIQSIREKLEEGNVEGYLLEN